MVRRTVSHQITPRSCAPCPPDHLQSQRIPFARAATGAGGGGQFGVNRPWTPTMTAITPRTARSSERPVRTVPVPCSGAGLPVSRADITGMGVGGLLMEIVTRPQPRDEQKPVAEEGRRAAAVILAAGRSTRMGAVNKLLAEIGGKPLVRIAAEHALAFPERGLHRVVRDGPDDCDRHAD